MPVFPRRSMFWRNTCLFLGFGCLLTVYTVAVRGDEPESVTLSGRVQTLEQVLKDRRITVDTTLVADQVVLLSPEGTVSPLLPNGASKAFFLDERLRDRPAEVTAWRHSGLPFLEVVSVRVEKDGKLRTPEYFCEVCTISVRYPQVCPCCQGPMELRYQPAPGD